MLTHALYDKSVSRSIVYLASVCDLTQRASVSMRKCADWVNLKFVYGDYISNINTPVACLILNEGAIFLTVDF